MKWWYFVFFSHVTKKMKILQTDRNLLFMTTFTLKECLSLHPTVRPWEFDKRTPTMAARIWNITTTKKQSNKEHPQKISNINHERKPYWYSPYSHSRPSFLPSGHPTYEVVLIFQASETNRTDVIYSAIQAGCPCHFSWANQRKADIKIFSRTQCKISKDRCNWHILAGNEERIVLHTLLLPFRVLQCDRFTSEIIGIGLFGTVIVVQWQATLTKIWFPELFGIMSPLLIFRRVFDISRLRSSLSNQEA